MRFSILIAAFSLAFACTGNTGPVKPMKADSKMADNCDTFFKFFKFVDESPKATIADFEKKAIETFPGAYVDNRQGLVLVVNFNPSLACLLRLKKEWGQPESIGGPPSPPPAQPGKAPLKFKSIEDDPFRWWPLTYKRSGRTIVILQDNERIKLFRIDPK